MANLKLKFSDLVLIVTDFLSWTNGIAPTGTHLTEGTKLVASGYRKFLYPIDKRSGEPYDWTFLNTLYNIPIVADKWRYQLPEDFSHIITDPTYADDEGYKHLRKMSPEEIQNLRAAGVRNYAPFGYCIVPAKYSKEVGSLDEIWFYPEPDSSYPISFWYRADPLKLENDDDYLVGGVKAAEAIIENCLAVAEQREEQSVGIHTSEAEKLTQELIITDSKRDDDVILGNLAYNEEDVIIKRGERSRLDLDNVYPDE